MKAYCVRCKKKVQPDNLKQITIKRGRYHDTRLAITGTCPKCRTKVFRFVKAGFTLNPKTKVGSKNRSSPHRLAMELVQWVKKQRKAV